MAVLLRCFRLYRYATICDTILASSVLPCEIFLQTPVKIAVHVLAAGFQLSHRKFYGFFYNAEKVSLRIKRLPIYSNSYGSKITDFYFSALSRLSVMLISPVSINVHKS